MAKPLAAKVEIKGVDHLSTVLSSSLARVRAFSRGVGSVMRPVARIGGIVSAAVGGIGIAAATTRINAWVKETDELAKLSRQLGMTTANLQELRYVGEIVGVGTEDLDRSLQILNKTFGALRLKTGPLYAALERGDKTLLKQVRGAKSTTEAFDLIIDALSRMKNPADRAMLATAAFGRSGAAMTRFTEGGAEGLAKLRKEAQAFGLVSDDTAGQTEEFADNLTRVQYALKGVGNVAMSAALPALNELALSAIEWSKNNKELIGKKLGEWIKKIGDLARRAAVWLGDNSGRILEIAGAVGTFAVAIAGLTARITEAKWDSLVPTVIMLGSAFAGLKVALIGLQAGSAPLLAIAAAIISVGLAIDKTMMAIEGFREWEAAEENRKAQQEQVTQALDKRGYGVVTGAIVARLAALRNNAIGPNVQGAAAAAGVVAQGVNVGGELKIVVESSVPVNVQRPTQSGDVPVVVTTRRDTGVTSMISGGRMR